MNLIRKGHGHTHRGIIGIESAIVMIAFVIVAAALAFVVLNTGFSTSQKAKSTITSSLGEASSGLEIVGKVVGLAEIDITTPRLNATSIPIKVASGGHSVNLDPAITQVAYLSNSVQYENIYQGTANADTYGGFREAIVAADGAELSGDCWVDANMPATEAFVYWSESAESPPNDILDQGEHAVLGICFGTAVTDERPAALDVIRAEIIVATGASLTIERQIPAGMSTSIVDLG